LNLFLRDNFEGDAFRWGWRYRFVCICSLNRLKRLIKVDNLRDICDSEWCSVSGSRGSGRVDNVVHLLKSFLDVLVVESANGECRHVVVFRISLVELSPSASRFCDGMDGGSLSAEKHTNSVLRNNDACFDALEWCREEVLWRKSVSSRSFAVNDVCELTKFNICSMNVLNGSATDDEFADNGFFVVIPSSDACVGSKSKTIDGNALFAKNESDVVCVDEKSSGGCCEGCRLSFESHD
jgi:hypothetical protein